MSDLEAYLWIAAGVTIAVLFPLLRGFIASEFQPTAGLGLPTWLKRYGGLLVFSLITSVIVLALFKSQTDEEALTWWAAFLLGFGWESALEKIARPA